MNSLNTYNESIRKDIALEFGLEAGGYAPQPKMIPIRIAQRINDKYPPTHEGRKVILHPMGIRIAKRYMSLVMGVK
jgi:hypothetical protein